MSHTAKIFPPSKFIKDELEKRDWKQTDLALVLGRTTNFVSELITDKRRMTPEIAQELAVVFDTTPNYWLDIDNHFRLAQTDYVDEAIIKRKNLFTNFPISEMQKRGWISDTDDLTKLEPELKNFFETEDLEKDLELRVSYKRTAKEDNLNKAEKAWICRAKQLAKVLPVRKFNEQNFEHLLAELRATAAKSKATQEVPQILSDYGIRYVVVEPLRTAKIDGAAFWLDPVSPTVAMSIRFDNIGSFWFTLMHELAHIKFKDDFSFDTDLEQNLKSPTDPSEERANEFAATILIPTREINWFITKTAPYYSKEKINQFANKIKLHPGIIIGQLQHRKEVEYYAHRTMMTKVREFAVKTAFTDGYGQPIPLKIK